MSAFNTQDASRATAFMLGVSYGPYTDAHAHLKVARKVATAKSVAIYSSVTKDDGQTELQYKRFGAEFTQSIPYFAQCPFLNGQIFGLTVNPELALYYQSLWQSEIINYTPQMGPLKESFVQPCLEQYQEETHTRAHNQAREQWAAPLLERRGQITDTIKSVLKNSSGFDIYEITNYYPLNMANPETSLSDCIQFMPTIDKEVVKIISQDDLNHVCAIFAKREITIHQVLKCRYLVLVERKFIDDSKVVINDNVVSEIKHLIEPNSANRVVIETYYCNGFITNNRFLKKMPKFKEQIKQLMTYLVGTDWYVRIHDTQPTCQVLYNRYDA